MSRHDVVEPEGLPPARGFSYGIIPAAGRVLHLAGVTGHRPDMSLDQDLVDQFSEACRTVARVLGEAGGEPGDVVSMTIFTTDISAYRDQLEPIGEAYRAVFGRHYPPMALIGVAELMDRKALVELVCVAVVP